MTVGQSLILFFVFLAIVFILLTIKKFYYRFYLKKKYNIIPRANTKGITSIGMTVALTVAIVLLLMIVTADVISVIFRAWVGTRIILEGILIKIGGLMFGPIIGLCIGAATDFLTISLTGGVFHIGYFISAAFFGLLGGMIKYIVNISNKNEFKFSLFSTILLVFTGIACFLTIYYLSGDQNLLEKYSVTVFAFDITLPQWGLVLIIEIFLLISIGIVWGLYLYRKIHIKRFNRGKLLEETFYDHYNLPSLYRINYLKIKHIYNKRLMKQEIDALAHVCSTTSISVIDLDQLTHTSNLTKINHLLAKGLIEVNEKQEYQVSSMFKCQFLSTDYKCAQEKKWIKQYLITKNSKVYNKSDSWFMAFAPVFVCIVIGEIIVNIMTVPAFDAALSTLNYNEWLLIRTLLFIPMVALNLLIIYPVFKIITPNVKLQYIDECEDI